MRRVRLPDACNARWFVIRQGSHIQDPDPCQPRIGPRQYRWALPRRLFSSSWRGGHIKRPSRAFRHPIKADCDLASGQNCRTTPRAAKKLLSNDLEGCVSQSALLASPNGFVSKCIFSSANIQKSRQKYYGQRPRCLLLYLRRPSLYCWVEISAEGGGATSQPFIRSVHHLTRQPSFRLVERCPLDR